MLLPFSRWLTHAQVITDKPAESPSAGAVGAQAQFLKGLGFEKGDGVPQDHQEAAHWYGEAAEQNHILAQLNLATLYGQGPGTVRDEAKALMWLTRAAKLGNAAAQYRLGVQEHLACRKRPAERTTENRIEALKWVRLSAAQGYREARNACEFVALGMSLEEVAESARRVADFTVV